MSAGTTNGNTTARDTRDQSQQQRARRGRPIDEIIEAPLQSADVQPGQYPSRFMGFGETTIWLPSKFVKAKGGKLGEVEKMNALFAVRVGEQVRILSALVTPAAAMGLSSMSTLYKFVKVLGAGDASLWDGSIDNIKRGAKLSGFTGKTAMTVIGRDKKGFARVEDLVVAPEGIPIPFPSEEEGHAALEAFLHSGEADASLPDDAGDVPF